MWQHWNLGGGSFGYLLFLTVETGKYKEVKHIYVPSLQGHRYLVIWNYVEAGVAWSHEWTLVTEFES